MKKPTTKTAPGNDDDMRAEYDFRGGVRGKYYKAMQAGYTIIIHRADGSSEVREVRPTKGTVVLEPDVQPYFPDSEAVNTALRSLIRLIPAKSKPSTRKTRSTGSPRRVAFGGRSKSGNNRAR